MRRVHRLIKGAAVPSCVMAVSSAQGAPITTLEGLATKGKLDPVQQAWIDEQVPAVRVLSERSDPDGQGAARAESIAD